MGERLATIIIEPRLLVRQALVSVMASHPYHVVVGVASTADIDHSLLAQTRSSSSSWRIAGPKGDQGRKQHSQTVARNPNR